MVCKRHSGWISNIISVTQLLDSVHIKVYLGSECVYLICFDTPLGDPVTQLAWGVRAETVIMALTDYNSTKVMTNYLENQMQKPVFKTLKSQNLNIMFIIVEI